MYKGNPLLTKTPSFNSLAAIVSQGISLFHVSGASLQDGNCTNFCLLLLLLFDGQIDS